MSYLMEKELTMNTSKEEFKTRINICYQCEHYRAITKQCKKCNCFLFLKAFLKNSECPIGKWRNETQNSTSQN